MLSGFCFSGMNFIIRFLDMPTFQLVFFRSIGSVVCCLLAIFALKIENPIGNQKKWLILRGLCGVVSMLLFFKAIKLMPLGSAVTLRYISPFFAAGLSLFFLKEKMRAIQWFYFFLAFMGVAILKGFDTRISLIGLMTILAAAWFSGVVYFLIRKIGKSEHPIVIITYFMVIASIVGAVGMVFNFVKPEGIEWVLLMSMGIIGFVAQWFMTKAFQIEASNKIVPFKYAEVIFTIVGAYFLFGESQSFVAIAAILLIVFALIANVKVKSET